MNDLRRNIILILCFIPFFRDLLRVLYNLALRKVKFACNDHPEIIDIYLTSKMSDHDFIYGSSDLNLIFMVENSAHPREILINLRKSLSGVWPVNMLVNLDGLHVFKEAEIQTPLIRSYLSVQRPGKKIVTWKSILKKDDFKFTLKEQDHFSIQRNYVKLIETFLLNKVRHTLLNRHWIRSFGKNIFRSIKGLKHYNIIQGELTPLWQRYANKIIGLSWFSRMYFTGVKVLTFKLLDFEPIPQGKGLDIPENYPDRLVDFCKKLLNHPLVEDIVLNPALIQLNFDEVKGRIYIDLILGQSHTNLSADYLHNLSSEVSDFIDKVEDEEPKYVFSFNTYAFMKLKAKHMLSGNPLESIYRYQNSHSLMDIKYHFTPNKNQLQKAAIHYLLGQFMQFRSMEHKTHLIGSRFIKSLNIIYRYQLLLDHLKGKEFAVSHSYKSIMEELTPQLSHIKPNERVTKELWPVVRAQMLFLLKRIRDELAKENSSLKNLQF